MSQEGPASRLELTTAAQKSGVEASWSLRGRHPFCSSIVVTHFYIAKWKGGEP